MKIANVILVNAALGVRITGKRGNVVAEYWGSKVIAYLITIPLSNRLLAKQMECRSMFVVK